MRKYLFSIACVAVALMGLSSCSIPYYITYDSKIPAEWNKPSGVTKLGLINHTPDSLSNVGAEINHRLADRLSEEAYLEEIVVLDSVIHEPMYAGQVNRLTKYLDVDCLASLDTLTLVMTGRNNDDKVAYVTLNDFLSVLLEVDPSAYSAGYIHAVINMYLPNQSTPYTSVEVKDHFDWQATAESEREATQSLPSMEDKIGEMINQITDVLKHKMVPYWQTVHRSIYVKEDTYLVEAKKHVNNDEWNQAAALWREMYKKKPAYRMKALAAHNLFVYYEKISNPDEAIRWCKWGANHFERCGDSSASVYLLRQIASLEKRKEELKRLDQQIAE